MPSEARLENLGPTDDWSGIHAVVAGFGVSGSSAADTLQHLGARVTVVDEQTPNGERVELLEFLGVEFACGPGSTEQLPADVDLVIASPGWRPDSPLFEQASARGVPVWVDVELAWRLRGPDAAPWLAVTGTNGKTTTVGMIEQILHAADLEPRVVGNVGAPILEAVMDPEPFDVLVVELSSFQLHWIESVSPHAAVVLNVADDHLDWHGGYDAYLADKARIYERTQVACVWNDDDPATLRMVENADVIEGARAIGFTLGVPDLSMVGVVDDLLVDRAWVPERTTSAAELASIADLPDGAPHTVANALAAAALTRSLGVPPIAVRNGLREFRPADHRMQIVAEIDSVKWIDDSKATNAHAARAALLSVESAVWIAGGLAKGAQFDSLVTEVADRLRAVVVIGNDPEPFLGALAANAPGVQVVRIEPAEDPDRLMDEVVAAARELAQAEDRVLLAPAAASQDQFRDYGHRGDAFAAAVGRIQAD